MANIELAGSSFAQAITSIKIDGGAAQALAVPATWTASTLAAGINGLGIGGVSATGAGTLLDATGFSSIQITTGAVTYTEDFEGFGAGRTQDSRVPTPPYSFETEAALASTYHGKFGVGHAGPNGGLGTRQHHTDKYGSLNSLGVPSTGVSTPALGNGGRDSTGSNTGKYLLVDLWVVPGDFWVEPTAPITGDGTHTHSVYLCGSYFLDANLDGTSENADQASAIEPNIKINIFKVGDPSTVYGTQTLTIPNDGEWVKYDTSFTTADGSTAVGISMEQLGTNPGGASPGDDLLIDGITLSTTAEGSVLYTDPVAVLDTDIVLAGVATTYDVGVNDTPCAAVQTTTYQVKTGTITNATATSFAGSVLSFTPSAAGNLTYEILCDAVVTDEATFTWTIDPVTAVADSETIYAADVGVGQTKNVSTNDTACTSGTTTYAINGAATGATAVSINASTGVLAYTPSASGSVDYNILCDGVVADTATLTWTLVTADAVADTETLYAADIGAGQTKNVSTNDTACASGTTTYAINGAATGASGVSINATTGVLSYTPSASGSVDYDILCDAVVTDTATLTWTLVTATADNDSTLIYASDVGVAQTLNASTGDTACSSGATTYALNGAATNGAAVSIHATTGVLTYTPSASGTVDYDILCAGVVVDTGTITWTLVTANAVDDPIGIYATDIGNPQSFNVGTNDTSCSSGATTFALNGAATGATGVSVNATSGLLTYTPTGDGNVSYDILCAGVVVDTATATWTTVTAAAADESVNIYADDIGNSITYNVSSNDTACASGVTTYQLNGAATNATAVSINATTGVMTYTPSGTGSQDYDLMCDGVVTATATLTWTEVTATAVNDTSTGLAGVVTTKDVSTNDTACSAGTTTYTLNGAAVNATAVSINATTGVLTYTPSAAGFQSYNLHCDGVVTDTGTLNWTTTAITATAADDTNTSAANVATTDDVSANDTACSAGTTTYQLSGAATNGTGVSINATTGVMSYTPTGNGSQDYDILCDGVVTDTGTLTWTATAATATAVNDTKPVHTGSPETYNVSVNDTACSSGATTYALNGAATNATAVTINGSTGVITFTPSAAGSVDYDILCAGVVTDTGTLSWTIIAAVANPDIIDVSGAMLNAPQTFDVTANDTACSTGTTTYQLNGAATNGAAVSINATTGLLTYTPLGTGGVSYDILCDGVVTHTGSVSWVTVGVKKYLQRPNDLVPAGQWHT